MTPLPKPGTKWRQFRHDCAVDVIRDLFEQCGLPRKLHAPIGWVSGGGGLGAWLSGERYPQGITFYRGPAKLFNLPDPRPSYTGNALVGDPVTMSSILKALWPSPRIENLVYGNPTPLTESCPKWFREKTTACTPVKGTPPSGQFFGIAR